VATSPQKGCAKPGDEAPPGAWPVLRAGGPGKRDVECARLERSWLGAAELDWEARERAVLSAIKCKRCFIGGFYYDAHVSGGVVAGGPMLQVPLERLRQRQPFTAVRYNDGEFYAMRDYYRRAGDWMCANCDGLPCPRSMVKSMLDALKDERVLSVAPPNDMKFLVQASLYWDGAFGPRGDLARFAPGLSIWVDDWVHHYARTRHDLLERFYAAARALGTTLVGPCNLRRLCQKLKYDAFIEIPVQHCSPREAEATVARLVEAIRERAGQAPQPHVFLVSASMLTNAVAYRLFAELRDRHFFIDIGSSLDIFLDAAAGEKMVPKRMVSAKLAAVRRALVHPDSQTLERLAGAGKLYPNASAAAKALSLWNVGAGGQDCDIKCTYLSRSCKKLLL